jgi:transaldolase
MAQGVAAAAAQLAALAAEGVDLAAITAQLEREGVASFAASFASLLAVIERKGAVLVG